MKKKRIKGNRYAKSTAYQKEKVYIKDFVKKMVGIQNLIY